MPWTVAFETPKELTFCALDSINIQNINDQNKRELIE
jgi:hypothetical protein